MKFISNYKTRYGIHIVLIVLVVLFVFPVIWAVIASLKLPAEIMGSPLALPKRMYFGNYLRAWEKANYGQALINSTVVCVAAVGMITLFACFASYAFARFKFKGKLFLFLFLVLGHAVQFQIIMIPLAVLCRNLKLANTLQGLIFPQVAIGMPLSTLVLTGFFKGFPTELEEAAKIDGCSDFKIFWKIVAPISWPAISAVIVFQFMFVWQQFLLPLVIIRDRNLFTIPLAVQNFVEVEMTDWGSQFAALVLGMIPVILVYIIFQRTFVRGATLGSLKE